MAKTASAAIRTGAGTARRQPGNVSKSIRKSTSAGSTGNVADGGGSGNSSNLSTGAQGAPGSPLKT